MSWSWLIYLVCPLMMIPMAVMMWKDRHSDRGKQAHQKRLIEELHELKKHNETMRRELMKAKKDV